MYDKKLYFVFRWLGMCNKLIETWKFLKKIYMFFHTQTCQFQLKLELFLDENPDKKLKKKKKKTTNDF